MKQPEPTEITITHTFKANDMVTESDLLLRFKIRELLNRTNDVSLHQKIAILEAERTILLENELDNQPGMQIVEQRHD